MTTPKPAASHTSPSPTGAQRLWRLGPDTTVASPAASELSAAIDTVVGLMSDPSGKAAGHHLHLGLHARSDGAWQLVASDVNIAHVPSDSGLAPLLEGILVGFAVRTRADCAALHGAAIVIGEDSVLLVGEKMSGKSTLTLRLADGDARYLSDEVAFVDLKDLRLWPFPKSISIKQGSFGLLPEAPTFLDPIRGSVRYHKPAGGGDVRHPERPPSRIVFPLFTDERSEPHVGRLRPEQTALMLVQQCFGGIERAPGTLEVIGRLSDLPAFAIEFADARDAERLIRTLVHQGGG